MRQEVEAVLGVFAVCVMLVLVNSPVLWAFATVAIAVGYLAYALNPTCDEHWRAFYLHPIALAFLIALLVKHIEPVVHQLSLAQYTSQAHYEFVRDIFGLPWYDSWLFPSLRALVVLMIAYGIWKSRAFFGGVVSALRD